MDNPYRLRWDCEVEGRCFNEVHRPRVEILKDCLPGKISFGDVDSIVQIGRTALILEFKSSGKELSVGQTIMFESLARHNRITVFVIGGAPRNLEVERMMVFHGWNKHPWFDATLDDLRFGVRWWAYHAALTSRTRRL
jgi:hypothetical protein